MEMKVFVFSVEFLMKKVKPYKRNFKGGLTMGFDVKNS